MYEPFYGFEEKPFKLTPDPAFLFLSATHEEAWAHLKYALSQDEGFMVITGEVGTGKTTLCRSFMEQLDDTNHVAYIFNPKMDARQLLQAVNDEWGLVSESSDTIKTLMDRLNSFLLERKIANESVLLLIDEAQNLSVDILEQLRMLSNLETTKEKLLLIVLVGQPELVKVLESHELRQLTQRISLSCSLLPLDLSETSAYIASRCSVAAKKSIMPFSGTAVRMIHQYSGGIPRLINIACDRALLVGFNEEEPRVTRGIVRKAIGEVSALKSSKPAQQRFQKGQRWGVVGLVVLLLGIAFLGWLKWPLTQTPLETSPAPPQAMVPPPVPIHPEQPQTKPPSEGAESADLATLLALPDNPFSREGALLAVLSTWDILPQALSQSEVDTPLDEHFFRLTGTLHNLKLLQVNGPLEAFIRLNHPGILVFQDPLKKRKAYLACVGLNPQTATVVLASDHQRYTVPLEQIKALRSEAAFVYWHDHLEIDGTVNRFSPYETVLALQQGLNNAGFENLPLTGEYDTDTREAVRTLQWQYRLPGDGIAGPETQILLNQLYSKGWSPRLHGRITSSVSLERMQIKKTP